MLFIRLWHFLCAVKIFDNGMIADNIHVENILQGMYVQEQKNQAASEMEAVLYNNYFYVGLGSCYRDPDNPVSGSYAHVCVCKFNSNLSLESGYPINHWMPPGNSSPERIKGLEFSPNCDRLFVTYSGQNNLYAINTSGAISNTIMNNPDFTADLYQYSEIETGADGNLYYLHAENNETGGISQYNPNSNQWATNDLQGVNKVYFSHDYGQVGDPDAKILLFQDQRDYGDYSLYFNNMSQSCCIDHIYYSNWPNMEDDAIWDMATNPFPDFNGVVRINEDVVVPAGRELTIRNMIFKFSAGKKLIVEPGAKLVLDNSTMTSVDDCGLHNLWQGIEVQGNSTLSQYPQLVGGSWVLDQGKVEIINGSTIENAVCGIKTINADGTASGGIIRANDATFHNCKTAIEFMPYQNHHPTNPTLKLTNFSLISQCTFETDDNLYAQGAEPVAFISLAGVQGVKIYGNTFTNTITQNYINRGIGILSTYSSFYLLPVCTSQMYPCPEENYKKNTFNGLQYGVWASSPASQFNIKIKNCIFTRNFGSISLNGITNAEVIDNYIDVGPRSFSGDAPWDLSYGLMLEQCTGYTVEENNFLTNDNGSYGVIVRNSGPSPNIIYRNTFDGSIIPFHVEGKNGFSSMILRSDNGDIALPTFSGLVLKCNDFQGTNNELWDIEIPWGSISPFQGSCYNDQTPAGNQFDHPVGPYGRIAVNYYVSPFTYFHHSDQITTPYISSFFINSYHVITLNPCGPMSENTCLSNFSNCNPVCLINNINFYSSVLAPWKNQIIKGNNQNLLNRVMTVNTAGGISFAALRDTLLRVSPYVSDTILIAAIEKYDTLEPEMLKDIIVANSPLTYKVKTVLDTKALPDRVKQAIDSVQNGISARNELEAKISDTAMLMGLAENELMRQYMNDTTIVGIDSVISYFLQKKDNISRKILVQAYYSKGDSSNLILALDSLRLQTIDDTLFKEFYSLMADFCTNKNLLYNIDSIQEQTIRNIASSKTEATVFAQTVLAMVYKEIPSIELEKIYIPDSLSIHGYLRSDSLCSGLPLAGDTIFLLDADTNRITFLTPVITDSAGYFAFYLPELLQLSDNASYGFGTTYAAPVKNFELKTIEQWIAASPLNLTLRKTEADFIYDTIRCYAGSVHFTSIVTDGKKPYTYSWDFGNDSVSTSPNPAMLFDTTGAYHVTLVVSSTDGCTDTVDKTVIVNPLPEITITTSDSTICKGDSAILTGSGGATYLWSTSDTSAVITIAPDLTTTYTVTVTSAEGCTNTASFTITVNSLPTAAINSSDSTICAGDSVTLTASGGVTYLWNTADTTAAIIVVPNTTTTYTVTVTSTEECIDSANKTVTVNILPTAAITPASSSICTGDSVTLTASGGVTYLWNTADTATVITVVPDSTTTYKVTVLSAEGCEDSDTATITIDCASITGRTMYAGKANVNTAPNPPTYNSRTYDINKEIVILKNQSGTEIARDTSDANGAFSFTNVDNGTYTLFYDKYTADTMQWCNNVNAVDIALIKYLIASDTTTDPSRNFSRIYKKSADVDNNGTVDSIDRARIQAKVAFPSDPTKNFPKGNWVNLDTTVIVNGANLNVTIPVISYGDYNASSSKYKDSANTWSQVKSLTDENIITISDESLILNNTGIIAIPLQISSSLDDFAAMSLELFYPKEKFKLVSASMPNTSDSNGVFKINPTLQEIIDNNNDLLVTDDSGIIRVVFATTNFFDVTNNDIMIYLGFRPLYELKSGELNFKLFGTGIITDQYGKEAKDMDYLLMPKIFVQGNHTEAGFDFTGYPNPFNNSTTLTYNLPKNGTVKLRVYNVFGVCVSELVNEEQMSGKHSVVFSAKNQPAGMYSFRLDFTGENDSNCVVLKMIYYK
ncbi:MAG: PKD domain-containing protein [Bacteroidales bacterium]|nr:PKD domain-containing protein [Bacteroidales bacterium]